ncbi:hypothetical protein JR648_000135 [Salmonella enterica]|nr:hypothetical protein [Salmonella enterica subsp. enterica serovar Oranienburg]EHD1648911.1 hypothetical protein [Salmonella enterica]EHJ3578263.1 hypothetical protein [Salmonella enterica]HAG3414736.1 hypothetical protein [Salmonella enterica]
MKTTFSARFMQRMALTTALCAAFISTAHADDLNIKTMIPGVPQIDAESYILIDYNSGKVLAEQNADERRDPASLTKMMTSYVIGQAMKAGYNLVASATEGQMRLISAVMGGRTYKGRETESKKLLTWGFRFFETVNPLKAGKEFASEPAWFGNTDRASLGVDKDVYLTIPRGRMKDLKASYVLNTAELHAPLQKNQVVGTINFQLDGKTIEQRPLVVLQEIPEGNFFGKIIDYIKLMFHHWFG